MTPDTPLSLTGLNDRSAAHRLDHHAVFIQKLKIDERIGRNREIGGAILRHRNGSENAFVVEVVPVHRRRHSSLSLP